MKELVRAILQNADRFEWSLQGFGMLRLHLSDRVRVNVWDTTYRVPNVSMMHTHPWDFSSTIVVGQLTNSRYALDLDGDEFNYAVIQPGPGGGKVNDKGRIRLRRLPMEIYGPGDTYEQQHAEIHLSLPADGTVTLNDRRRVGEDRAFVFWPIGQKWVSAEPRQATKLEVSAIVGNALKRF